MCCNAQPKSPAPRACRRSSANIRTTRCPRPETVSVGREPHIGRAWMTPYAQAGGADTSTCAQAYADEQRARRHGVVAAPLRLKMRYDRDDLRRTPRSANDSHSEGGTPDHVQHLDLRPPDDSVSTPMLRSRPDSARHLPAIQLGVFRHRTSCPDQTIDGRPRRGTAGCRHVA